MRVPCALAAVFALVGVAFCGDAPSPRFSRETPTVLAVRKVKDSVVTVRVQKPGARKDTIGTGVVVDERGCIVTNRHVIANHESIKVTLADATECKAEVDFEDASYDLAVLRIRTDRKLKALPLGPASDLMDGEKVIAIGHPFGYVNTVSEGIVSALGRDVEMPGGVVLKGLIQVTAAINPGNSGGPLLNVNGELIGINVALRQDAQGIAFAINADTVQQVLSRKLSASRKLGLYHGMDCREKVEAEGEKRSRVLVHDVAKDTPASAAGVREGDELLTLGSYRIGNRFDVERALWDAKETVVATVKRGGKELRVPLKLGDGERAASR